MSNVRDEKLIKKIGLHVRTLRNEKKLSQQELANLADIELSQVSRIELGKSDASISTLSAIAKALKIKLVELFDF